MVDSIQRFLRDRCTIIVFYVKRSRQRIEKDEVNVDRNICKLKSHVSLKEARQLGLKYKKQCTSRSKERSIKTLVDDVEKGQQHTLFEFGLALHSYEYSGIEPYVREFLLLRDTIQPWQTALAYLSIVYYYGQASVPCKFLAGFLGPDEAKRILVFEDFPDVMKEFMVKDVQERKTNMVRITHYYVAKEILDQILDFPNSSERKPSPYICKQSKRRLGNFSVRFIKDSGNLVRGEPALTISYIMTRTFILRDNKAAGENETHTSQKRRPKFAPILEDVTCSAPYTQRFDILQQLTKTFPNAAQFRAHLGRLYTICRPEETESAERCFKEALDTIFTLYKTEDEYPHFIKLDLMHIYHMYGNMMLARVAPYTGKYLGDNPKKSITPDNFETTAETLLPDVIKACSLFEKCRDVTPLGCEESFRYIGEIQLRLMFCSLVHHKSGVGIHEYCNKKTGSVADFVKECYITLDELFLFCFSSTEPEKIDADGIITCQKWYDALFGKIPGKMVHKRGDNIASRRLQIAKIKMMYCSADAYGILEKITEQNHIRTIVEEFEKNFRDYESEVARQTVPVRIIDFDHREWLFAIRHQLFQDTYRIEKVLEQVEIWYDHVNSPHSRFYLFVLKSLIGFGCGDKPGDPMVLTAAQQLKDEVLKHSKYVVKPRYPREWLGKERVDILRLVPGKRFFAKFEKKDIHGIDFSTLAVLKGTICAPNEKPAVGYISLDLGPRNRVEVRVFFVPARTAENLKGTAYNNARVEFVLGFSLSHGYEAFNVYLLGHETCMRCKKGVEKRSCDKTITCPRCKIPFNCKPSKASTGNGNGVRK